MADPEDTQGTAGGGDGEESTPGSDTTGNEGGDGGGEGAVTGGEGDNGAETVKAIGDYSLDEIMAAREDVGKLVQSTKDKAADASAQAVRNEYARREDARRIKADEERLREMVEKEDFDGIGRERVSQMRRDEELANAAADFSTTLENAIREYPDVAELGNAAIKEVYDTVKASGGNAVDFMAKLFERRNANQRLADNEKIRADVMADVEAKLETVGQKERDKKVEDGEAAIPEVSGGTGGATVAPKTWLEAVDAYNAGTIDGDEFEPFRIAHEKEVRR